MAIQGFKRRMVYVALYECLAIIFATLLLQWMTGAASGHSLMLAIAASLIAILWNLLFNYGFEQWEARSHSKQRTLHTRVLHALGFEGGLVLLTVPLLAWWFSVSWLQALLMDVGLLIFFLMYTFVFHWLFDWLFGLPETLELNK